ncbi:MAG TPA: RDD family protein [Gaiellaceae bacterium]|nr:RDD family protein [Gaiellaceae bacterium]
MLNELPGGLATSPAPADAQRVLAGWWSRVAAFLIDWLVLIVAIVLIEAIARVVQSTVVIVVLFVGWAFAALIGYWVYFEGSASGQTPGKHALGIRVRGVGGGRASYGQALGRNLLRDLMAIFWPVGIANYLWPLWDRKNQCLHDKAASTIVVRYTP